mgnify:CR=1 FL=1
MSAASREHVSTEGGTTAQETQPKDDSSGESVAESEASSGELPLDQVFEILKNQRRREVLAYLRESETEVTLGEVAEHIAENLKHARQHSEVIQRFGRFPHRNKALGRRNTAEEEAFLQESKSYGQ